MCDFDDDFSDFEEDGFDDQWESASLDGMGPENGVPSDGSECDFFTAKDALFSFGAMGWAYEEWIERAYLSRRRKRKNNASDPNASTPDDSVFDKFK